MIKSKLAVSTVDKSFLINLAFTSDTVENLLQSHTGQNIIPMYSEPTVFIEGYKGDDSQWYDIYQTTQVGTLVQVFVTRTYMEPYEYQYLIGGAALVNRIKWYHSELRNKYFSEMCFNKEVDYWKQKDDEDMVEYITKKCVSVVMTESGIFE